MDQYQKIPAFDDKTIHIVFNTAKTPTKRLVILSHGLTGNTTEFLHVMVARHLTSVGYDVVRIAYYGGQPNSRHLYHTTLETMSRDLTTVIAHYRPTYKTICVAGHSYGGLATLLANPNVAAISFWDSAFAPTWWKDAVYHPESNDYDIDFGSGSRVSQAVYDEAKYFYENPPIAAAQVLKSPAQVMITGGDNAYTQNRIGLYHALPDTLKKSLHKFDLADHQFTNGHSVEQLLDLTQYWFDSFTTQNVINHKKTLGG